MRVAAKRAEAASLAKQGADAEAATPPDLAEAIARYTDAVRSDTGQAFAKARLDFLLAAPPTAAPSPYALARSLAQAGFDEAAKSAAIDEVKIRAGRGEPPAIPSDIRYLVDDSSLVGDGRALVRTDPIRGWAAIIGLVTLGAVVLWGIRDVRRGRKRHLVLGEIPGTDDGIAASIKGTIATEIELLRSEVVGDRLGLVMAPDASIDIPVEVFDELPKGKLISALWKWMDPAPWTLTGSLLWDPGRGDGIALRLLSPYRQAINVTIWDDTLRVDAAEPLTEPPKSFSAAHARLARAAGAWLAFTRAIGTAERDALMTRAASNWRSYALFRMGAEAQAGDDTDDALRFYAKALGEDPMNPSAAFNAGVIRLSQGPRADETTWSTHYLARASALFERVDRALDRQARDGDLNTLRYRYIYNCALVQFEMAVQASKRHRSAGSHSDLVALKWDEAVAAAQHVFAELAKAPNLPSGRDDLAQFVDLVEDAAFGMYGGALARRAKAKPAAGIS